MENLADYLRLLSSNVTQRAHSSYEAVTVTSEGEGSYNNVKHEVVLRKLDRMGGVTVVLKPHNSDNEVEVFDFNEMIARAAQISQYAYAATQYRQVLASDEFKKLYGHDYHHFKYVTANGHFFKPVESGPCMICGLVLPWEHLSVDHQRPKAHGGLEAVLKVFRAQRLTVGGPQGQKGKAFLANQLVSITPRPGRVQVVGNNNVNDRYKLNSQGTVLYTLIVSAGKKAELISQCTHNLLNLKPTCQRCNSSRGEQLKFEALKLG